MDTRRRAITKTHSQETFITQTNLSRFANPYIAGETDVLGITAQIQRLETDDQLAALWYIYTKMGRSIAPAALEVARFHLAER